MEPRLPTRENPESEEATGLDGAGLTPVSWGIGTGIAAVLLYWLLDYLLCNLFLGAGMETGGYGLRAVAKLAIVTPTVIVLARRRWGATLADLGIVRPSRETILWAVRVALVLGLVWLTFGLVLAAVRHGRIDVTHLHTISQRSLLARDGVYWAGFVTMVSAPINEELVHRGLLYRPLRDRLGPRWAIPVSALVFTAVHVSEWGRLDLQCQLFLGGLVMAWAYEKTRSLVFPVAAHFIHGTVAFTWELLLAYRPEWIQAILG